MLRGVPLLGIVLLATAASGAGASISPTDARIVYVADGRVHVMDGDGSRSRALAEGVSPTWSPDGTTIAFEAARVRGSGLDIYIMNADGSAQSRLAHPSGGITTADDYGPAWSPAGTGRTIAFTSTRDGNAEIYTMDSIGHSVQRVTSSPAADREPAWSPDGETIAFVSDRDGGDDLYSIDRGLETRRLTSHPNADRAPAFSPDGRSIAFQSFRDGNWELYVMAADGSNPRRLTESPAADTNPSWSPAGDAIVFTTASPTGAPQLATVGPEGGAVRILTSGDQAEWQSVDDVAVTVRATRSVRRGRPLRLRVLIRNKTEMPAYNVLLRTSFPAGFRVLRARSGSTQSCGRSGARSVTCWLPRLGGSATAAAEIVLRPQRCGRASLQESVVGGQADFEPADNRRRLALRVTCPRPTQRRTNR